ncbi:MAG: hypothetical protein EBY39_07100 [Flavobacteriia bacterium]|nr:hypothetical protein [Flavobacteriia bacterium]
MIVSKKIELINGNLLNFPNGINRIAHSCNTHNVMGAGIARNIRLLYPHAYASDCEAMMSGENSLGNWSFAWADSKLEKGIYNMYTQEKLGGRRAVNYEAFYNSLEFVAKNLEYHYVHDDNADIIFGLPYGISCGLAGGNWKIINAMIEDILLDMPFKTYIVKYDE